jgi:hypothetical protein
MITASIAPPQKEEPLLFEGLTRYRVTRCLSSLPPRDVQRDLGVSLKSVDWHRFKDLAGG